MNTKKLLEEISEECISQLTKYKYNKNLDISEKYRKGKITSYEYILNLIYHFFEKDKAMKTEFECMISKELEKVSMLKNGDYQKGIVEVLSEIKSQLNK